MTEKVWDSAPEEGDPRFIDVSTAREAIARDPKRYSLGKPDAFAAPAPEPERKPEPIPDPAVETGHDNGKPNEEVL